MKLTIINPEPGLIGLYESVARQTGYTDTSTLYYDCRKIEVSKNIQDSFFEHYRKEILDKANEDLPMSEVDAQIAMLLLIAGPKMKRTLFPNEVEVYDGFIVNLNDNNAN